MKHDVLLIGGSGFVGKAITQQLQTKGYSVLIPSRRYSAIRDLRLLPSVTLEHVALLTFTVTVTPKLTVTASVLVGVAAEPATPLEVVAHIAPFQFPVVTANLCPQAQSLIPSINTIAKKADFVNGSDRW